MSITETLEFISREGATFADFIRNAADKSANEAELVSHLEVGIDRLTQAFGIELLKRKEYTLAVGRADAVYNRLIIEYERPDSLRDDLSHGHTKHAVQQVKDYIGGLADKEGHKKERILGVAFDGRYFIYVRYREGHFHIEPAVAVNEQTTKNFLTRLFSLSTDRALIPENLVADFGPKNLTARNAIKAFYYRLEKPGQLTDRLYRQWQLFFSEVAGFDAASGKIKHKKELTALAKGIGVRPSDLDAPRFFFALHTYFSFLVKLIAHTALQSITGGGLGAPTVGKLSSLEGEVLQKHLRDLEDGGYFHNVLGIKNLLEGDFFRWYLDAWDDGLEKALRNILAKLADYTPATLHADPYATRDLLKALYHNILPRDIRHDLGEFYTPDWLAERVLIQLGDDLYRMPKGKVDVKEDIHKPLLDPACGSGTFLILAIRALKENLRRMGLAEGDILEVILHNIVGIDLNPMAVMSARVNYLLAILDLVEYRKGDIEIPIYLADSVVTPELGTDLFKAQQMVLKTVVGELPVPMTVDTREEMDKLTGILEEHIPNDFSTDVFLKAASQAIEPTPGDRETKILRDLYERLLNLHRRGLDGIWPRIIKNAFMPRFLSGFHYVVGNPPWINWESLPEGYRNDVAPVWGHYNLFQHKGFKAILGHGKDDISALFTYVAIDRFLRDDGKLSFVITQSVWKTAGGGKGFRQFMLPGKVPIKIQAVEDLSNLQVFEGASTRTSIFIACKGEVHQYPTPYTLWQKTTKGKRLGYDSDLEEVISMTRTLHYHAQPVNNGDPTSSWLTGRRVAINALQKVLGQSAYKAREGVNTGGANGVYWLDILGNRPDGNLMVTNIIKGAKRKVDQIQVAIESDLLHPLLRGRDVKRWLAEPSAHVIITHRPDAGLKAIAIEEMQDQYPKTYTYLKRFEKELRERSGFKRYFTRKSKGHVIETGPFYSMFNVGEYTFTPWKVVWQRVNKDIIAAVVAKSGTNNPIPHKLITPTETAVFIPLESEIEAHFICGVMNSSPWRLVINSTSVHGTGGFGSPNVLEKAFIPLFKIESPLHKELAKLSASAHRFAAIKRFEKLADVEEAIDQAAAQLWGLTEKELEDIRANLAELQWKPE